MEGGSGKQLGLAPWPFLGHVLRYVGLAAGHRENTHECLMGVSVCTGLLRKTRESPICLFLLNFSLPQE